MKVSLRLVLLLFALVLPMHLSAHSHVSADETGSLSELPCELCSLLHADDVLPPTAIIVSQPAGFSLHYGAMLTVTPAKSAATSPLARGPPAA